MEDNYKKIKHIVYLMLENRSLDNVLGWLYENGDKPANLIVSGPVTDPAMQNPLYNGLYGAAHCNLDKDGNKHCVVRGTQGEYPLWVPESDPNEEYQHVNVQIFGHEANPSPGDSPSMCGFYIDYALSYGVKPVNQEQIMMTYSPEQLPVLSGAARNWAVSDAYFSSVPTQTNCNRAFAATGNSIAPDPATGAPKAWVNNNMKDEFIVEIVFDQQTFFNVLEDAGKDWKIFSDFIWPDNLGGWYFTRDILKKIQDSKYDQNFEWTNSILDPSHSFYGRAKAGTLPAVSFIEPNWGFGTVDKFGHYLQGNDYHPPTNVAPGEQFVADIINALQNSPQWDETLLIINFDEHGGTYDHVAPQKAATPWDEGKAPQCECDFAFDRFGVRVPCILVSPLIEKETVFRSGNTPLDHTAVIATILKIMDIPKSQWNLGNRVNEAQTFENVITRSVARTDKQNFQISAEAQAHFEVSSNTVHEPNDLQRGIANRMVVHYTKKYNRVNSLAAVPNADFKQIADAKTLPELSAIVKGVIDRLQK